MAVPYAIEKGYSPERNYVSQFVEPIAGVWIPEDLKTFWPVEMHGPIMRFPLMFHDWYEDAIELTPLSIGGSGLECIRSVEQYTDTAVSSYLMCQPWVCNWGIWEYLKQYPGYDATTAGVQLDSSLKYWQSLYLWRSLTFHVQDMEQFQRPRFGLAIDLFPDRAELSIPYGGVDDVKHGAGKISALRTENELLMKMGDIPLVRMDLKQNTRQETVWPKLTGEDANGWVRYAQTVLDYALGDHISLLQPFTGYRDAIATLIRKCMLRY